jgi:membrane protein DedA with SNARE-associated domain
MFDQVMEIIRNAHPITYFVLLILAGMGIPISEDLLTIWAGGAIGRGAPHHHYWYILALYSGVLVSDMLTFFLGRLAHDTLGGRIRRLLLRQQKHIDRAVATLQKHGNRVGFIQRFSLGARLPITLMAGYSGMSPWRFLVGTALGAVITLSLQLSIGYMAAYQIMGIIEFLRDYGGLVGAVILGGLVTLLYLKIRQPASDDLEEESNPS